MFGVPAPPKAAYCEILFGISKINMRTSAAKCEFIFNLRMGPPTLSWCVRQERGVLSGKCRLVHTKHTLLMPTNYVAPENVVWPT